MRKEVLVLICDSSEGDRRDKSLRLSLSSCTRKIRTKMLENFLIFVTYWSTWHHFDAKTIYGCETILCTWPGYPIKSRKRTRTFFPHVVKLKGVYLNPWCYGKLNLPQVLSLLTQLSQLLLNWGLRRISQCNFHSYQQSTFMENYQKLGPNVFKTLWRDRNYGMVELKIWYDGRKSVQGDWEVFFSGKSSTSFSQIFRFM